MFVCFSDSGPQLRQDDPSSLKDIVLLIQPAVAKVGEGSLSVRTKFMIDTITDLKNNRLKAAVASSVTSEHLTKMRKILGSLHNSRAIRATEPIRISRADILNSSKRGKWWLVGASWKDGPLESENPEPVSSVPSTAGPAATAADGDSDGEPDLLALARAHRMNTDVRRSIFIAIMSATDYQDAHVRLLKLRLKRVQEFEIPRVLVHCATVEESYNPYYTLIARRLCAEMGRRIRVSFMYALWNTFKLMGERDDLDGDDEDAGAVAGYEDDDDERKISTKAIFNLAKMYGTLVADGTLTLSIVKTLNFAYLQPKTKTFMELFLINIIIQQSQKRKSPAANKAAAANDTGDNGPSPTDEKRLADIFLRTREVPHVASSLIFFLRKAVSKTDLVPSGQDRKLVRWGCRVALDALTVVSNEGTGLD